MEEREFLSVCRIERTTLELWLEQGWLVRPDVGWSEVDVARVRLIRELQADLAVNEAGVDLLLAVLDRLYATRGDLARLVDALRDLPEPERHRIVERLHRPVA